MNMACTSPIMPGNKVNMIRIRDLVPIVIIAGLDNLLYVSPKTGLQDGRGCDQGREGQPRQAYLCLIGSAAALITCGAQFTYMANIDMLHVPFRGGPPAIAEIVAGRVDMMFGNLAEILPHINSGAVRPSPSPARPPSPVLPGVPTIAQSGLPDYRADNWFGLGAPAGTLAGGGRPAQRRGEQAGEAIRPSPRN